MLRADMSVTLVTIPAKQRKTIRTKLTWDVSRQSVRDQSIFGAQYPISVGLPRVWDLHGHPMPVRGRRGKRTHS